ncbi:MAG: ABC transporter ATP-binding protein [Verrucomicrobiota bacterium]
MSSTPDQQLQSADLSNGRVVARLLGLCWRYPSQCLVILGLQVLLLTMGMLGILYTGVGVDVIGSAADAERESPRWPGGLAPPADWDTMSVVWLLAGFILLLALVRSYSNYLYNMRLARFAQDRIVAPLRSEIYEKLQRLSFRFFDQNASGSIINRVTGDVLMINLFMSQVMMQSIIMVVSLVIYIAIMATIHLPLTLACLATTPVMMGISIWFSARVRPLMTANRKTVDQLILNLSESIQGVHVIKSFGREPDIRDKFQGLNRRIRQEMRRIFAYVAFLSPSTSLLSEINLAVLLAYGGYLVFIGEISIGAGVVVFAGLLQQYAQQVSALSMIANLIQQSMVSARRVFEILDAPVEIVSDQQAERGHVFKGEVEFERVSFDFEGGATEPRARAIHDLSFKVKPGQVVALLGPLGSGKSTLMSLIPRFYDPTEGRVKLDGVDLRELALSEVRQNIGLVFQENFLFSMTVAQNIAFGHPGASREQIERAATIAAAHDFVMELPQGYDTIINESGVNLSGGQRQRLAIARAILRDPAILLMDDPTAAVDAETEHEILEALEGAIKGRTVFIASHKLSALVQADIILVLNRGRIMQVGSHRSLREQGGYYKAVAEVQLYDDDNLDLAGALAEAERASRAPEEAP